MFDSRICSKCSVLLIDIIVSVIDKEGNDVFLRDIWPSADQISEGSLMIDDEIYS